MAADANDRPHLPGIAGSLRRDSNNTVVSWQSDANGTP